jgi:peptide deformylase
MIRPMALIGKKKINILHTPSEEIEELNQEVIDMAKKLRATARVHSCYAVAAVQVGVPINMVAWKNGDVAINIVLDGEGEMYEDEETCLSLPGKKFIVPRFKEVHIQATFLTELGPNFVEEDVDGFSARVWQHEYDHIEGKLLSD